MENNDFIWQTNKISFFQIIDMEKKLRHMKKIKLYDL